MMGERESGRSVELIELVKRVSGRVYEAESRHSVEQVERALSRERA